MISRVWSRQRAELRHGLRILAAGLSSFALAQALALPQGYWAVFTAVLVVQSSVGSSLKAAIDRLAGTLLGAIYGAIVATLIPHGEPVMLAVALAISLTPLAFAAALSPSYRVAPLTAIILLLGNNGSSELPAMAALLRTLEVGLGGFVGLFVSMTILPARGHALVGRLAEKVAQLMAVLTEDLFKRLQGHGNRKSLSPQHDAIQAAFDQLESAAQEANRERKNLLADKADPDPIPRTLRRLYHDLVLISRVADEPLSESQRALLYEPLSSVGHATAELLRGAGRAFASGQRSPTLADLDGAIGRTLPAIAALQGGGRVVALAFALEQMERNFRDLARRADEFARPDANAA